MNIKSANQQLGGIILRKFVILVAILLLSGLAACANTDNANVSSATESIAVTENHQSPNEVIEYFSDKYNMEFLLWGPEGHDLYAFYIYPDHAERECQLLMPRATDDVSICHKDLSWSVDGSELIISGDWEESFKIDISADTATSTTNGKIYKIYEMQPPLE